MYEPSKSREAADVASSTTPRRPIIKLLKARSSKLGPCDKKAPSLRSSIYLGRTLLETNC